MRRLLILAVLCTGALVAGCTGRGYATYSATATYSTPQLAYVSPGVYVIQDWNEPVFYTDNLYWRYYDGRWFRSRYYDRGWVYSRPPRVLRNIDRPYAYVRYRPSRRYQVDRNRHRGPVIRDHRRNPYYR